jgi:hypothetical protein
MNEHFRRWWHDLYPDEIEICSDGTAYRQSFASKVWRDQAKEFLNAYIAHLQKIGVADSAISYQVGAGHTGEWIKGKVSILSQRERGVFIYLTVLKSFMIFSNEKLSLKTLTGLM